MRNNLFCGLATACTLVMALLLQTAPAKAGFPLTTEDTGTLGQGNSKIELTVERGNDRTNLSQERSVTQETSYVYGLLNNLNGSMTLPYRSVRSDETGADSTRVQGFGDAKIGVKWRFFEQQGLSLGAKAVLSLPTGDDSKLLGSGRSTQAINVIASQEGGPWEFDVDLGYRRNGNTLGQRENLGSLSLALVRSLDHRWKIMADVGMASNHDLHANQGPAYLGAGVSLSVKKDLVFNMGLKCALTSAETDFTGLARLEMHL